MGQEIKNRGENTGRNTDGRKNTNNITVCSGQKKKEKKKRQERSNGSPSRRRGAHLGQASQYQSDQLSDVGEGGVTSGVPDVFAADVQHRAQRNSTQRNVVAHVQEQAVQMLPQLHRLHSRHKVRFTRKQLEQTINNTG